VTAVAGDRSALTEALAAELRTNARTLVLAPGECAEADALLDEFGSERVRIETTGAAALVAVAVGVARGGYRPVVILPTMDDLAPALEPLAAMGSKLPPEAAQKLSLPILLFVKSRSMVRRPSWEAWCAHVPWLNVAVPATLEDGCALLKSALTTQTRPVVFIEHDRMSSGPVENSEPLGFGKASLRRPGKDLSVVAYGRATLAAQEACKTAASKHNIDAELIDLRTLAPLDLPCVLESVKKTGRVLLCADAPASGAFVSELSQQIVEQGFDELDAPIRRACAVDLSQQRILSAIRELSVE
jgi:pyruvate dehydrogenase E1 component beta subunit